MTRQEQFKTELLGLLRRYDVAMTTEDASINFYSPAKWDVANSEYTEQIDLYFVWEDGKE